MATLNDLRVLDALCESPALSLTSKRALAQVSTITRVAVWRVLRSKLVHVHPSDRTLDNVKFLRKRVLGEAADNDNFDMVFNVVGKTMSRRVSLPGYHCNYHYDIGQHSAFPLINENGRIDHTTAYFLGHLLAKHATLHTNVNVRFTTGYEVDLNHVIRDEFFEKDLREALRASALNRAVLSGALLRNAKRHIEHHRLRSHTRLWRTYKNFADLNALWLENEHMVALGPKLRARAYLIGDLDLRHNRFDARGMRAVFDEPASSPDDDGPRWPMLEKLSLACTPMGCNGCPSLCRAIQIGQMPKLKELNLSRTGLDSVGARLLFESLPHAPNLERLLICDNPIGLDGLASLKRLPPSQIVLPKLKLLHAMFQAPYEMSKDGYRVLAQALLDNCFPMLETVETHGNDAVCVSYALFAIVKRREWLAAEKRARKEMRRPGKRAREEDDDSGENTSGSSEED